MPGNSRRTLKSRSFHAEKWVVLLALVILLFLIIRWPSEPKLPIWDESVYLSMGKYLYSAGRAGLWESIRPIGLPLITGLLWEIGGMQSQMYLSRVIMLLFAAGALFLTYLIGRKLYDGMTGLIAASLLAASPVFFHHSGLVLTDIISTFFILAALYIYLDIDFSGPDTKMFYVGLLAAAAAMFRFPHGIIFLFFIAMMLVDMKNKHADWRPGRKNLGYFILGIFIIIPFLLFNYITYSPYADNAFDATFRPFILGSMHQDNMHQAVPGLWHNAFYYLIAIMIANPLFLLAFFSIGKTGIPSPERLKKQPTIKKQPTMEKKAKFMKLYILMWIYLIYLTYIANKQERFLLMILPVISILASGLIAHYIRDNKGAWKHVRYSIIAALLIIIIAFNIQSSGTPYYANDNIHYEESRELYTYYQHNDAEKILTTDPLFAVYSDKLFIPFYDVVGANAGGSLFVNYWESYYDFDAVVYTPSSFPCIIKGCEEISGQIYDYFSENYVLEAEMVVSGRTYYFFIKE